MLKLRAVVLSVVAFSALVLMASCGGGVSEQALDDIQKRIDVLTTKGLPDDSVSGAVVHISEARVQLKKDNKSLAKKSFDSLNIYIDRAEKYYNGQVANLGPTIDEAVKKALDTKSQVSGYQSKKIDSALAIVDSLRKMDWLLKANAHAQELVAILESLKADEARVGELKKLVPGDWEMLDRAKSVEFKEVNALTRKLFTFRRDGSVFLVESKNGQSGQYLKEFWEFNSWGTYDFKGDTIMIAVSRFKAVRQDFERIHKIDGKEKWVKEPQPRYDSLITDGSQDRFITFTDLKEDFTKKRSY